MDFVQFQIPSLHPGHINTIRTLYQGKPQAPGQSNRTLDQQNPSTLGHMKRISLGHTNRARLISRQKNPTQVRISKRHLQQTSSAAKFKARLGAAPVAPVVKTQEEAVTLLGHGRKWRAKSRARSSRRKLSKTKPCRTRY